MTNTSLNEIIISSATAALELQRANGSMPAGHNGPYHDPETPVRNTAHWLITFAKAYKISGDNRFLKAVREASNYLSSTEAHPYGYTFHNRTNPEKDKCNGLIGQAWAIEALAVGAQTLGIADLTYLGEQVFMLHPFDEIEGLWSSVEIDGTVVVLDPTLNHQIWFAAAGSLLSGAGATAIRRQITRFLDTLPLNMSLYATGLIRHKIAKPHFIQNPGHRIRVKSLLKRAIFGKQVIETNHYRAIGYHSFNLYGLSLLKQAWPEHTFWKSKLISNALDYIYSSEFLSALKDNKYGYPYNPPGLEIAFAIYVFSKHYGGSINTHMTEWVFRQLSCSYDSDSSMMQLNTADPATHAARLYEAARLPDINLKT